MKLEELKIGNKVEVDLFGEAKWIIKITDLNPKGKTSRVDTISGILEASTARKDQPFVFDPRRTVWSYIDQVRRILN